MDSVDYCIVYWHGINGKVEVYPHLSQGFYNTIPQSAGIDHIVKILNHLSFVGWTVISNSGTKGKWMWVLKRE